MMGTLDNRVKYARSDLKIKLVIAVQLIIGLVVGYVFSYAVAFVWFPGEMAGMTFVLVGGCVSSVLFRLLNDAWTR